MLAERIARRPVTLWLTLGGAGALLVALGAVGATSYALMGVMVILFGLALLDRPQRGILLVAALAPYDGLLLVVPHPQILKSWKEALVLATLLAGLLSTQGRGAPGRRRPGWVPAAVGLVLVGLVSSLTVPLVQAITGFRIDFFYILLAWAAWRTPLTRREVDRLVTILMVNGVITSLVGLAQQAIGAGRLNELGYQYNSVIRFAGGHLRSFSTFNQPFPFGFFLMLVLLVGLPVALSDPRRTRNRIFLFSLPLLGLGMLTTIVRGAWLGAAVGWIYLGVRRHKVLLLAVPLALLALFYLPGNLAKPALSSTSTAERTSAWSQNLHHVIAHPVGEGIGSTGAAAQKTASLIGAPGNTFQPDNYYFKTVYELGVPGLYFLVLWLVAAFADTSRSARLLPDRFDASFTLGVSASLLAAITASTVATYFEIYPMDLFTWLLLGVVASVAARREEPAPVAASRRIPLPLPR